MIGDVSSFLRKHHLPALPYLKELKNIRDQRNLVQHSMIKPSSDIHRSVEIVERFFERALQEYFGISKEELRFSLLVEDEFAKELIHEAETSIDKGYYREAIIACRDAFEYAKLRLSFVHQISNWTIPNMLQISEKSPEVYNVLYDIQESMVLSSSGIDMPIYHQYKQYVEIAEMSGQYEDGGIDGSVRSPIDKSVAELCYSFICSSIMAWQTNKGTIKSIQNDCGVIKTINRHEIHEAYKELSSIYVLDDAVGEVFYISNQQDVKMLKDFCGVGYLLFESDWEATNKAHEHHIQIVKVVDFQCKKVLNNPETWEVFLKYRYVPFTHRELIEGNDIIIDIDSTDLGNEIAHYSIIRSHLPLKSYEQAEKLDDEMKNYIFTKPFYSSILMDNLLKEIDKKDES